MSRPPKNVSNELPDAEIGRGAGIDALEMSNASGKTKSVVIYGINYAPEPIGVGRYTGELGAFLAGQGHSVSVVTAVPHYPGWSVRSGFRNFYKVGQFDGVSVVWCPLFLRSEMHGVWRVIAPLSFAITSALVASWKIFMVRPDVVLCVEPTLFSAPIAVLCAKLVGARIILHVQDIEVDAAFAVGHLKNKRLQKLVSIFERFILSQFSCVVTISYRMREKLLEKGVEDERLSVVRNWVDMDQIKPLDRRSSFRDELGIDDKVFVSLYSGNVGKKQALQVLADAVEKFDGDDRFVFVIVGDGPEKQKLMTKYGMLENLIFLPVQPEDRLCDLLNLADVHLLPQDAEAEDLVLPSKLGGMLASGKPCIVMANPGTELYEFLEDAAHLIPPGDVQALVSAVKVLAEGESDMTLENRLHAAQQLRADKNLRLFSSLLCPV